MLRDSVGLDWAVARQGGVQLPAALAKAGLGLRVLLVLEALGRPWALRWWVYLPYVYYGWPP